MADPRKPRDKVKTPPLAPRAAASERADDDAPLGRNTVRVEPPPGSEREGDRVEAPATVPRHPGKGVELIVVDEPQLPVGERRPWRAAEVWTKRRVYGLDSTFKCVEILDRGTGRPEVGHEMLGARLGGGRLREEGAVRFSYPLPLPGMEAMFMKAKKYGYTSLVERMVVRIRVLHAASDDVLPTWEEIASRWSAPPPR
ncbi:MAG: hypothetical protein KIS78_13920 [Labilithrix sp.]|nr:hypothetical protein [Labilithrix sp.]MCW5833496.1 hypothetical protein [Labilithrix sp.]